MKHLLTILFLLWASPLLAQSTKARTFNGSSDNLQSASTIDLSAANTISVSAWVWFNVDADTAQFWLETSAAVDANVGAFAIFQNDTGVVNVYVTPSSGNACLFNVPDPSTGAWHHYLVVLTMQNCTTNLVYIDGVSQTLTYSAMSNGTNFGNYTLNVMSRNATTFFTPGRASDIAIWTSALTSGNATSLAACANPQTVNGTPAFYWPINQTSPEVATDGSVNLTVTGTTNSASSCAGGGNAAHTMTLLGAGK